MQDSNGGDRSGCGLSQQAVVPRASVLLPTATSWRGCKESPVAGAGGAAAWEAWPQSPPQVICRRPTALGPPRQHKSGHVVRNGRKNQPAPNFEQRPRGRARSGHVVSGQSAVCSASTAFAASPTASHRRRRRGAGKRPRALRVPTAVEAGAVLSPGSGRRGLPLQPPRPRAPTDVARRRRGRRRSLEAWRSRPPPLAPPTCGCTALARPSTGHTLCGGGAS